MKRKPSSVRVLLRLLGPALLLVVLWRMQDRGEVITAVAHANGLPLGLAIALNAAVIHLKVVRWRALLAAQNIHYSLRRSYAAFLSSLYLGMVTPGRVGDALRIQYLRHEAKVSYADGLATVVMDRLCDLYVLSAFALVGIARFSQVLVGELAIAAWAVVGLSVLSPLVLLVPGLAERFGALVYRRLSRAGGEDRALSYQRFLAALRSQIRRSLWWTALLTVGAFGVTFLQGWLLAKALQLDISFLDVVGLLAIANLLGLMPVSISGVGIREAFFLVVFPVLGIPAHSGVSYGLVVFMSIYVTNIIVGFISWQVAPPPTESAADPS